MVIQHLPLQEPLASEVTTALIDLAALAQSAGSLAFEGLNTLADSMLMRLLALCKGQRGAVLLRDEYDDFESSSAAQLSAPDSAKRKALRAFALHNMHAEEAYALLTSIPSIDAQPTDMTCWVTYRLMPGAGVKGNDHAAYPLQALLVLGWTREHDGECSAAVERCHTLLPLVADALGAVIASILLAGRVRELETSTTREALEGMELLKAELLGTVSHELRGPLASIKGYAATLLRHERRLAREERRQFLLAINEASDRLEVIIERLLEISQLETGQLAIKRSPVDAAYLAGEAIAAIEERVKDVLPGRFIFNLRLEKADGTPSQEAPLILADPRRLREVLDNLLENTIKYSPQGGLVKVVVRPVVQAQPVMKGTLLVDAPKTSGQPAAYAPQHMLEICVCDDGLGIPTDHLERIFDRFHRVDTRLTREVNGLGLGLAICKHIVELHGGIIWAENGPGGKGSVFHVRLPMSEVSIV